MSVLYCAKRLRPFFGGSYLLGDFNTPESDKVRMFSRPFSRRPFGIFSPLELGARGVNLKCIVRSGGLR